MKKVEKYIELAIKEVENTISEKDKNNKSTGIVLSVYNGYISSMGASIIQSGLLPTLAVFEDLNASNKSDDSKKSKSEGDKKRITNAIFNIIKQEEKDITGENLLEYVLNNKDKMDYNKERIINIGIALKLAIRTFKIEHKKENS